MPFTKVGKDKYRSPSGRIFTGAQVRLYHAHNGFPKKGKRKLKKKQKRSKKRNNGRSLFQ